MKIHFMTDEMLTFLKGNVETNLPHYQGDNHWVEQLGEEKGIKTFLPFKMEVPDFTLDTTNEKPERSDYENVKILYTALKNISDSQATDERLWAGLAHGDCWDFMMYRWATAEKVPPLLTVQGNFFFHHSRKRSLIRQSLARMWWVGRSTYDEAAAQQGEDPFQALEYLKVDFSTKVLSLFSSNFTNNPVICRSILKAIVQIENDMGKLSRDSFFELIRYVNLLGGIIILDYLTEEELIEKVVKHYKELNPDK